MAKARFTALRRALSRGRVTSQQLEEEADGATVVDAHFNKGELPGDSITTGSRSYSCRAI